MCDTSPSFIHFISTCIATRRLGVAVCYLSNAHRYFSLGFSSTGQEERYNGSTAQDEAFAWFSCIIYIIRIATQIHSPLWVVLLILTETVPKYSWCVPRLPHLTWLENAIASWMLLWFYVYQNDPPNRKQPIHPVEMWIHPLERSQCRFCFPAAIRLCIVIEAILFSGQMFEKKLGQAVVNVTKKNFKDEEALWIV